jgi:hypothetical protein
MYPSIWYTDPDTYYFKEVMYLKLYFLHILTSFPCQKVQQEPNSRRPLLNFPFHLSELIPVGSEAGKHIGTDPEKLYGSEIWICDNC